MIKFSSRKTGGRAKIEHMDREISKAQTQNARRGGTKRRRFLSSAPIFQSLIQPIVLKVHFIPIVISHVMADAPLKGPFDFLPFFGKDDPRLGDIIKPGTKLDFKTPTPSIFLLAQRSPFLLTKFSAFSC